MKERLLNYKNKIIDVIYHKYPVTTSFILTHLIGLSLAYTFGSLDVAIVASVVDTPVGTLLGLYERGSTKYLPEVDIIQ